ncbi:substrate-binding periplasmic protein [Psychromonas ossibalaenae]|uniref:substrate-binding periplasmic protein n=1 Tax=Psychromonas ossibalaenae TaxID=444922 RepID=UPI0003A170EF|nr:transporter substrate-binding domain-containing protein [Psychromonas ossibalaenae]
MTRSIELKRHFRVSYIALPVLFSLVLPSNSLAEPRFVTSSEPPTNYSYAGSFTGTTTEIVKAIRDHLGWNNPIEVYPWSRAYRIALHTPDIVIFTAGKTAEREALGFSFVGPVSTRKHGVFSRADHQAPAAEIIKSSQTYIAAMRSDWRSLLLEKQGHNVLKLADHSQGLQMLMRGRVDYWVSSDLEAYVIAKSLGYKIADIKMVWLIKDSTSYMAFSPDSSADLIKNWQRAFQYLQGSDFFDQEVKRWSNILGIEVKYSQDAGYFIVQK